MPPSPSPPRPSSPTSRPPFRERRETEKAIQGSCARSKKRGGSRRRRPGPEIPRQLVAAPQRSTLPRNEPPSILLPGSSARVSPPLRAAFCLSWSSSSSETTAPELLASGAAARRGKGSTNPPRGYLGFQSFGAGIEPEDTPASRRIQARGASGQARGERIQARSSRRKLQPSRFKPESRASSLARHAWSLSRHPSSLKPAAASLPGVGSSWVRPEASLNREAKAWRLPAQARGGSPPA